MSTDTTQPPRICPECNHKSGDGPCGTCKPFGRPCTWCIHSGPVPTEIDPPAVEPTIDELPEYREPNGGM